MFLQLCTWMALSLTVLGENVSTFDLTYDLLNVGMPLFVNTSFRMDVTNNNFLPNQTEQLNMSTAVGTHVQAPCRYSPGKSCISDISLELLNSHVAFMDFAVKDPDTPITSEQVNQWVKKNGAIKKRAIVVINTGWSAKWNNATVYLGNTSAPANNTNMHFPGLSMDAAKVFINHGIAGIGIDTPSLDYGQSNSSFTVHKAFADANIYAVLNVDLRNVKEKEVKKTTGFVMPMKLKSAGAAPCRFLVITNGVGESLSRVSVFVALLFALLSYSA